MRITRLLPAIGLAGLVILTGVPSQGQAPKSGGWLTLRLREDLPQGFAIHESATISTMWPAMPCLSNLVLFDPLKPTHSVDTIVGELAERWAWQENYRKLVFFLRRDVRWHDGKPFSSKDVKYTFDLLRETPDAPAKLRLDPRRDCYGNVEAVDALDPLTVVFRLKHPQPSLLLMLASGFTPIYAAHVPAASYRTGCVGTGPFKVKDWRKGEFVEYVKNPDYFVKDRPYLDGLRYPIIAGYGEPGHEEAQTRMLLADAGFGPNKPLKVEVLTRQLPAFVDIGSFVIGEFRRVGIDASLRQVDTPQWGPVQTRGAFEVGVDRNGVEPDDPDANFYEYFGCGSPRNYTGFCNEPIARLIDQQSQELDPKKRVALVQEIQRKLEETTVRPALVWRLDYFTAWPYVKNLVPHHSIYSWGRMQEVWLDK